MIYRCIWSTGVNSKCSIFCLLTFLHLVPSYQMDTKSLPPVTITVKIISVSEFGVKMINKFIASDFPFRIICASYQIHRQHSWIRTTILQNLSAAPTPTHIVPRRFFKICIISFSYLVNYIYWFWHLFLFAPVDHITSQPSARIWKFQFWRQKCKQWRKIVDIFGLNFSKDVLL